MSIDDTEAPSTQSLWDRVMKSFGFGPGGIVDLMSTPAIMQQAFAMGQGMIEQAVAQKRIEYKLNLMMRRAGYDVDEIDRLFQAAQPVAFPSFPALPAFVSPHGAGNGAGSSAAAGAAPDHGSEGDAARAGGSGDHGVAAEPASRQDAAE